MIRDSALFLALTLLLLASMVVAFPPLAAAFSAGSLALGLFVKLRHSGGSDAVLLCRTVVLAGSGIILLAELFAFKYGLRWLLIAFAAFLEQMFYEFGTFTFLYCVGALLVFLAILASQRKR